MGALGCGVHLPQYDAVWDLHPSALISQPGEPLTTPEYGRGGLTVARFFAFAGEAGVAATTAYIGSLPPLVVVLVKFVVMLSDLRPAGVEAATYGDKNRSVGSNTHRCTTRSHAFHCSLPEVLRSVALPTHLFALMDVGHSAFASKPVARTCAFAQTLQIRAMRPGSSASLLRTFPTSLPNCWFGAE